MRLSAVIATMKAKGWKVYTAAYELNILALRSASTRPGAFDDRLLVFWRDHKGRWNQRIYPVTTDPGLYWLHHPMNPNGTAILASGQYPHAWKIGKHKGSYPALVQRDSVTVVRDPNRDGVLDFGSQNRESGHFGINVHRAGAAGITEVVDKWSAGCVVFASARDFSEFIGLCSTHRKLHDNRFTLALIDLRELSRRKAKRFLIRLGLASGLALLLYQLFK